MGNKAGFKLTRAAHRLGRSAGHIQVLGNHKLDALNQYIPAGGVTVGRDGHSLRPPLILRTVLIYLGKDNGQSDPLLGANVFHRHIHLQNRSHRLQIDIPRIYYYGIRTALPGEDIPPD